MPPKKAPESTGTIPIEATLEYVPRYTATQVKVNMLEGYINRLPEGHKLFGVVHVSGAYYLVITESE